MLFYLYREIISLLLLKVSNAFFINQLWIFYIRPIIYEIVSQGATFNMSCAWDK